MSRRLQGAGFQVMSNPYGILFNPVSVAKSVEEIIQNKEYSSDQLATDGAQYWSWNHHGKFRGNQQANVLQKINRNIQEANAFLANSDYLFLTLGSAWAYFLGDDVVANCHKQPASIFDKRLLTQNQIVEALSSGIKAIRQINSSIQIVFTVSPVRHWKDGVVENTWSKSLLHTSVHQLMRQEDRIDYFPSYELVQDDLRDYRFYTSDLLHPNEIAIDYVWEKFQSVFFTSFTQELVQQVEKLRRLENHEVMGGEEAKRSHLTVIEAQKKKLKSFGVSL